MTKETTTKIKDTLANYRDPVYIGKRLVIALLADALLISIVQFLYIKDQGNYVTFLWVLWIIYAIIIVLYLICLIWDCIKEGRERKQP